MRIIVRLVLWTWFIAALAVGRLEVLARLPAPGTQVILFALAALLLAAYFGVRAVRVWADALDLRGLVLLHVTRFVGLYFFVLYRRGELPYAFAVPGGWTDIGVATLALGVVLLPLRPELRRHAFLIWNTIALVDLLIVVATAARIERAQPWQLEPFQHLPLSMLPTFLVPLLLATHAVIYARLLRRPPETATPA
ncbi:MAG TPA: hypothetical protein VLT83_09295 [Opitutaceae bacterium]|nr:hypothetical protein [Opitutaceae bacterium]